MLREHSGREFHTRLGWWVMTHPRGGAAVIGWVVLVPLVAIVAYVAHQWHGVDSSFHRAFVVAAVGMWLFMFIADRLGVAEPLGTDRSLARRRARSIRKLYAPIPIAVVIAGYVFGTYVTVGLVLGCLAYVLGYLAVSAAREVVHPHVPPPGTQGRLRASDPG